MKRMHLHKKKKKKTGVFIFLFIFIFLLSSGKFLNNSVSYLLDYSSSLVSSLVSTVLNTAVSNSSYKKLDKDLFLISKNKNGEIEMIDYNPVLVNEYLNDISNDFQKALINLENGKYKYGDSFKNKDAILFYVPFGVTLKNPFLASLGPKIPVKMKSYSLLSTNINTKVEEYGINNALITMEVYVEIKVRVLLPLVSKKYVLTNQIPVSYKIITGKIPDYYSSSLNKSSDILSIPLE